VSDAYQPLRRQIGRRLVITVLLGAAVAAAAVAVGNAWLEARREATIRAQLSEKIAFSLAESEREWRRNARQIAVHIETSRIMEAPQNVRADRLLALFTALGEDLLFDTVGILDDKGRVLFGYGHEIHELTQVLPEAGETANYFSKDHGGEFHRVVVLPLWTGTGQGRILFLARVDSALLTHILPIDSRLVLLHRSQPIAASIAPPSGSARRDEEADMEFSMPLYGASDITLRVTHYGGPLVTAAEAAGLVLVLAAIAAALLYGVVGRWLTGVTGRIGELRAGAEDFAKSGAVTSGVQRQLDAARAPDELGELSLALDGLMHGIRAREEENAIHVQTLNLMEEAVLELDADGTILRANQAWDRLTGNGQRNARLAELLREADRALLGSLLEQLKSGEKTQASARVRLLGSGSERWMECRLTSVGGSIRGILRDITQTYLQEQQITHMALHDALTGLPNRVLLEDRCKIAISHATRLGRRVAVGFIDLDQFKQINDTLGHKVGDKVLIATAQRLSSALRMGDTLARWGGDEFVVLLADMSAASDVRDTAQKLMDALREPLVVDGQEYAITFSAGFVVFPDDADTPETLLAHADRAMFYAKSQGRNQTQIFSDMTRRGLGAKELYIQTRLAAAIREQRIEAHYQPIVSARNGRVVAVETLARWQDGDLGWVPPAIFVPMAENLGLVRELGEQVWIAALGQARAWKQQGRSLVWTVNLSRRQLFMPQFTDKLLDDLASRGLGPQDVVLEVTETVAMSEVEYAAERLKELGKAGFRIAVDDFGTGYSSLSMLHELPVSEIKIDISFVRRLREPQGQRLVHSIIQMARSLGLTTVAEGVENAADADVLCDLGVDLLQGYHYARPMPAAELARYLAAQAS
jgi:diguanylate cyclase (GGDEF)-like protein/PAS domain S-box-containing protein